MSTIHQELASFRSMINRTTGSTSSCSKPIRGSASPPRSTNSRRSAARSPWQKSISKQRVHAGDGDRRYRLRPRSSAFPNVRQACHGIHAERGDHDHGYQGREQLQPRRKAGDQPGAAGSTTTDPDWRFSGRPRREQRPRGHHGHDVRLVRSDELGRTGVAFEHTTAPRARAPMARHDRGRTQGSADPEGLTKSGS